MRKSFITTFVLTAVLLSAVACGSTRDPSDPFVGDWVSREGSDITLHVEREDTGYSVVMELPPNGPMEIWAFRYDYRTYKGSKKALSRYYIYFVFRDVDTMKMHFTSALDGSYVRGWFDRKQ